MCILTEPAGRFRSTRCAGIADAASGDCSECRGLVHVPAFNTARARAALPMTDVVMNTMPSQYLTMHQALELHCSHAEQISELRLALFFSLSGRPAGTSSNIHGNIAEGETERKV